METNKTVEVGVKAALVDDEDNEFGGVVLVRLDEIRAAIPEPAKFYEIEDACRELHFVRAKGEQWPRAGEPNGWAPTVHPGDADAVFMELAQRVDARL